MESAPCFLMRLRTLRNSCFFTELNQRLGEGRYRFMAPMKNRMSLVGT